MESVGLARRPARPARASVWSITLVATLLPTGCFSVPPTYEDGFRIERIDRLYAARDNCLRRVVDGIDDGAASAQTLGSLASQTCGTEARKLVELINPHRDPQVTARIAEDSASRAAGYVLQARRAKAARER